MFGMSPDVQVILDVPDNATRNTADSVRQAIRRGTWLLSTGHAMLGTLSTTLYTRLMLEPRVIQRGLFSYTFSLIGCDPD